MSVCVNWMVQSVAHFHAFIDGFSDKEDGFEFIQKYYKESGEPMNDYKDKDPFFCGVEALCVKYYQLE